MVTHSEIWAPFQPDNDDSWDLAKVAHLHRRAGFGATRPELFRDIEAGTQASVERLLNPPRQSDDEQRVNESLLRGAVSSWDADRLKAWWLHRMLWGPDPLREKMTLFWHGHFATSNLKVQDLTLMARQNALFRQQALGDFSELVMSIVSDPAMLIWLDGEKSRKEKPNENFARELLELFTLGPGQYSEADIRQAARAFTGWVPNGTQRKDNATPFLFDFQRFDADEKTFLGRTGAFNGNDIVRIVIEQPAAADFLCRRLYRFFVSETIEPTAELIAPLAEEFRSSGYSIKHVVGIILRSRHFYSTSVRRQRIASPIEFSVGLLRVLDVPRGDVNLLALAGACAAQGQDLFYPPNVKGWDGGRRWLNSTTLSARANWANDIVWGNPLLGIRPWDPLRWKDRARIDFDRIAGELINLFLQRDIELDHGEAVLKTEVDGQPDSIRMALQLLLHCPEIQLF